MDDDQDPKVTGAIGGRARAASMSPAERAESARRAARARWSERPMRATHAGDLRLGPLVVECAVLENGQRVINDTAFQRALGRSRAGGQTYQRRNEAAAGAPDVPIYLSLKSLAPFIPGDFAVKTVPYIRLGGGIALGVDAAVIPGVCSIWLRARREGALSKQQLPTADRAECINSALATVGIIALVDEATGYQSDRARDALAEILERFIGKELAAWAKTFDDDYYREMFRLRDWTHDRFSTQRPPLIGALTRNIVYARLAPAVLEELERKNPRNENGHRKAKHHQWLTRDVGISKLREHLAKVVALMQISSTWEEFMERLDYVAPKYTDTLPLFSFEDTRPHRLAGSGERSPVP